MRILFITRSPPYPPTIGGNQRSALIHRALSELGPTDVILVVDPASLPPKHLQAMTAEYGLQACVAPARPGDRWPWRAAAVVSKSLADRLASYVGSRAADYRSDPGIVRAVTAVLSRASYDLTVGRQLRVLAKAGLIDFGRTILDVDDVDTDYFRSQLHLPALPRWRRALLSRTVRQLERLTPKLYRRCSALWVAKSEDRSSDGLEDAAVLPNIPFPLPEMRAFAPSRDSRTVLVVAAVSQRPNAEGVDLFVREVWPAVLRGVPDARLRIVGSGMTEALRTRWSMADNVEPVGFVENLAPEYEQCAFTVSPVLWGGGTNIKVLESLVFRRTCVASRFSCKGFGDLLADRQSLRAADAPPDFTAGCVELLRDPDLRDSMAERGHAIVSQRLSYAVFRDVVHRTVEAVLKRQGA